VEHLKIIKNKNNKNKFSQPKERIRKRNKRKFMMLLKVEQIK